MVFPDYYFFVERYLVNHTIEKKRVNNLDDCELMCYLNHDWNDFFYLPWMFDAFLWQNKSSSYVCQMLNIVTARRAQK